MIDSVAPLSFLFFQLTTLLSSLDPNSTQFAICSPLMNESLAWFLERWAGTYLMFDPSENGNLSQTLVTSFSQENATQILTFYLTTLEMYTRLWHSEQDLMVQMVRILVLHLTHSFRRRYQPNLQF